jgi:hypothetical protein
LGGSEGERGRGGGKVKEEGKGWDVPSGVVHETGAEHQAWGETMEDEKHGRWKAWKMKSMEDEKHGSSKAW